MVGVVAVNGSIPNEFKNGTVLVTSTLDLCTVEGIPLADLAQRVPGVMPNDTALLPNTCRLDNDGCV